MTPSTVPARSAGPSPAGNDARHALSADDLTRLRRTLERQRAFRVEQLASLREPGLPGPLGSADHDVLSSLRAAARAALRDVQQALWRIDDGSYGECAVCHDPLGVERLEIVPQAALCMSCQAEADAPGIVLRMEDSSGARRSR